MKISTLTVKGKVVDGQVVSKSRKVFGLPTFDFACGGSSDKGLALPSLVELFGESGIGKTTIALSLAARKNPKGKIIFADLEGFDEQYCSAILQNSGFDGELVLAENSLDGDASLFTRLTEQLQADPTITAVVVDSLGAVVSPTEQENEVGAANMGKRAFIVGQFSRKITRHFLATELDTLVIFTNHYLPNLGGYGGYAPGGNGKEYLATLRMRLTKAKADELAGWTLNGRVVKNRDGVTGRDFSFRILPEVGIHQGLTILEDMITLGIIQADKTMKYNGTSLGYRKSYYENPDKLADILQIAKENGYAE